ncbi:serine protease [Paludibacter sp. 221]|uniref:serine protease n=1 Tax=Paludibacter sp. 221 TaxID=2302939 RepID=UPI0013D30ED2|nr:serine protease [Paludibacter sp. 221]NDV46316.1 serine protease [Paludibacter sp. 221]
MIEAYNNLDSVLKVYWAVALFASLIFIIQAIMTFVGSGSDDGMGADFDGDLDGMEAPFQLFSFRNLIHFLLGFGWTGISLYNVVPNKVVLSLLSVAVGLVFIFLFFIIIKQLMKLAENNSFNIQDTIGKTADVYLSIPAQKAGKGKIHVSVKGAIRELNAISGSDEIITTGSVVEIIGISDNYVIVNKV